MAEVSRGDSVRINGSGTYDEIDCESFTVNGTGNVSGDLYATRARIAGTAKVGGQVDIGNLDVYGTVKTEGRVRAETVEVDGTAKFRGGVTADRLAGDGTVKIDGDASVGHLAVDGAGKIRGNLDSHEVESDGTTKVSGSLVAANARFDGTGKIRGLTDVTELGVSGTGKFGDVNAETLTAEGAFRADDVTAATFDLALDGDSSADSVHATDVHVRRRESGLTLGKKLLRRDNPTFKVGVVEAKTVELDATRAKTVVGEHVTLGPDIHVKTVYTDDLDAHDEARIDDVQPAEAY